jgi:hypothetical protein
MSQLTLEIPDKIIEPFKIAAQQQNKQVEQFIIEQLALISTIVDKPMSRFTAVELFRQSGLLTRTEPPEKRSEPPLSEAERERLAQKLAQAGPLSKLIISEREEQL